MTRAPLETVHLHATQILLPSPLSSYILSQANGKKSEKKSARKKIAGWGWIETKILIFPFRDITKIRIAFSYVVSSKVFG